MKDRVIAIGSLTGLESEWNEGGVFFETPILYASYRVVKVQAEMGKVGPRDGDRGDGAWAK